MRAFTLYGLRRPDDKIIRYIGITCRTLKARLNAHLFRRGQNVHKDSWIKKMFPLKPEIVPFATDLDFEAACELEISCIQKLKFLGFDLINVSLGGTAPMLGLSHSKEAREKISEAGRGRIFSVETRKRISISNMGKPGHNLSGAEIENLRLKNSGELHPQFGKPKSETTKKRISRTLRGNQNARKPANKYGTCK